jgi:hypothetical protein
MSKLEDTLDNIKKHKENKARLRKLDEEFRKEDLEWKKNSRKHNKEYGTEAWKATKQLIGASIGLAGASAKFIGSYLLKGLVILSSAALIGGVVYGGAKCFHDTSNLIGPSYNEQKTVEEKTSLDEFVYETEALIEEESVEKAFEEVEETYSNKETELYETNEVEEIEEIIPEKDPLSDYIDDYYSDLEFIKENIYEGERNIKNDDWCMHAYSEYVEANYWAEELKSELKNATDPKLKSIYDEVVNLDKDQINPKSISLFKERLDEIEHEIFYYDDSDYAQKLYRLEDAYNNIIFDTKNNFKNDDYLKNILIDICDKRLEHYKNNK